MKSWSLDLCIPVIPSYLDFNAKPDASSQAAVAIPTNRTDTEKRPILALGCVMRTVSLSGCADSFLRGGGPHNLGTPAGTYTVTVTGSSNQ